MLKTTNKEHIEDQWIREEIKKTSHESKNKTSVFELPPGQKLSVSDCVGFNIYLVAGKAELTRRGMADQLIESSQNWNPKNCIFAPDERGSYIRSSEVCQILMLKRDDKVTDKYNKVGKNNPQNTSGKILTDKVVEVSIYDLDRPYDDTVIITKEESDKIKINLYDGLNNVEIKKNKLSLIYKIKKNLFNKLKYASKKIPEKVNAMAKKLDDNLYVEHKGKISNKHGTFSEIGKWKAVECGLPDKSGIYYISNGKDIDVMYFNKERGFFYNVENFEILFWSSEKVELRK